MAYIASVLTRQGGAWSGRDLDLAEIVDLDELADRLRDGGGETALCLLEEDDEYVAVIRVDGDEDPRLFVSDGRVLAAEGLASRLLANSLPAEDAVEAGEAEVGDDEPESGRPEVAPAGDETLLADLGVGGPRLLELCAAEGMLPSDVIFAIGEALGAADVLEAVRGV